VKPARNNDVESRHHNSSLNRHSGFSATDGSGAISIKSKRNLELITRGIVLPANGRDPARQTHVVRIVSLPALLQFCEASREMFGHDKCRGQTVQS
jgi:hypothetical protein